MGRAGGGRSGGGGGSRGGGSSGGRGKGPSGGGSPFGGGSSGGGLFGGSSSGRSGGSGNRGFGSSSGRSFGGRSGSTTGRGGTGTAPSTPGNGGRYSNTPPGGGYNNIPSGGYGGYNNYGGYPRGGNYGGGCTGNGCLGGFLGAFLGSRLGSNRSASYNETGGVPMQNMPTGQQPYQSGSAKKTSGCLIAVVVLLAIFLIVGLFSVLSPSGGQGGGSITASTVKREALPAGAVNETAYYADELGWIKSSTTLTAGLKQFYKKTGVQPYLYITDNIGGSYTPTTSDVERFAYDTYDELFTDEAHLLFIFYEYGGEYNMWYLAGTQAKTVLDAEAMDILMDYIDKYYYSDLTEDEMFSKAFSEAGDSIMAVTVSPAVPVLIVAGVLLLVLLVFFWWNKAKKQKNLEAQRTKEILDTPLQTFGSSEAENLAQKYTDSQNY